MREDMAQVIVERPRLRGGSIRAKAEARIGTTLPSREGMRRPHVLRGDPKSLNENLAPLRRYLERQVGRPWDKVYAEIAIRLRVDSAVQQHVRNHLHDFVAVKPRRMSGWLWRTGDLWWQRLYVDPRTGLLCRTDRLPEEKARRRARARSASPGRSSGFRSRPIASSGSSRGSGTRFASPHCPSRSTGRFDETLKVPRKRYSTKGGVIELELDCAAADHASRSTTSSPIEHVPVGPEIDETNSWNAYRRTHPDRRYAIAKRTLSRRELRRHGLTNAAPGRCADTMTETALDCDCRVGKTQRAHASSPRFAAAWARFAFAHPASTRMCDILFRRPTLPGLDCRTLMAAYVLRS